MDTKFARGEVSIHYPSAVVTKIYITGLGFSLDWQVMNEVALHRGSSPHLNTIDIFVDDQHLTEAVVCVFPLRDDLRFDDHFKSDGIIVSVTPPQMLRIGVGSLLSFSCTFE